MNKKNVNKALATLVITTMFLTVLSGCIGEEKETPAPTTAAPTTTAPPTTAPPTTAPPEEKEHFRKLPSELSPTWRTYFENVDFDGDGVLYVDDKYLGRDDNTIDFEGRTGGTFRGMGAELSTVDPIQVTDTASSALCNKIYDGLVQIVPYTTKVMPDLAKAWEVSADGKVYTFYLRDDVYFHNGDKCTAHDFVFSYNRLINPDYASPRRSFATNFIDTVEAVNDYTVKITLLEPFAPFLSLMTYSCFLVLPADYVSKNETVTATSAEYGWYKNPIGTGPWKFCEYTKGLAEYIPGDHYRLEANKDYHEGRPYLDYWNVRFVEEDDTIVQAWKAGQIELTGIPGAYWEEFNEKYKDQLLTKAELATFWLILNCDAWPFNNVKMRQAVTCALDRAGVLQTIFKGRYQPAHGPLPPGLFGFSQELYDSYEFLYDPEKAKALLDEAGAKDTDGDGIREYEGKPLKFELSSYVSSTWKEAAKVWIDNMKEVGIEMTYQQYDFPTIIDMNDAGEYVMLTLGWIVDYPDPENFYILFETKGIPDPNGSRYSNPEVDALIQKLRTETNPDKRKDLAYKIEKILQEECPHIWFFHSRRTACIQTWLHDYNFGPMGAQQEKRLELWLDPEHR